MKRALVLALLAGCALDHHATDAGADLTFTIGGVQLHVASGTARPESDGLGLYLTDQPDACLAITRIPVGTSTIFALRVAAQADGTTAATVVPAQGVLGAGEAEGDILVQTDGVKVGGVDAVDGTVTWTANEDGTTTIVALDVGFAGTTDRLRAGPLTVPPCR